MGFSRPEGTHSLTEACGHSGRGKPALSLLRRVDTGAFLSHMTSSPQKCVCVHVRVPVGSIKPTRSCLLLWFPVPSQPQSKVSSFSFLSSFLFVCSFINTDIQAQRPRKVWNEPKSDKI